MALMPFSLRRLLLVSGDILWLYPPYYGKVFELRPHVSYGIQFKSASMLLSCKLPFTFR